MFRCQHTRVHAWPGWMLCVSAPIRRARRPRRAIRRAAPPPACRWDVHGSTYWRMSGSGYGGIRVSLLPPAGSQNGWADHVPSVFSLEIQKPFLLARQKKRLLEKRPLSVREKVTLRSNVTKDGCWEDVPCGAARRCGVCRWHTSTADRVEDETDAPYGEIRNPGKWRAGVVAPYDAATEGTPAERSPARAWPSSPPYQRTKKETGSHCFLSLSNQPLTIHGDVVRPVGLKLINIGVDALVQLIHIALVDGHIRHIPAGQVLGQNVKNTLFSYSAMASWMPPSAKAREGTISPL